MYLLITLELFTNYEPQFFILVAVIFVSHIRRLFYHSLLISGTWSSLLQGLSQQL